MVILFRRRYLFLLLSILLLAFLLRFYNLATIPSGLDWDETSSAYNGYSLLKTGKDEFGARFPILFRAFDAYVPPVLIYLNSLSVGFWGLNEFGARFPNAFLGVFSILGIYLLILKLRNSSKEASLVSFFLAVSPWHIMYTRINTFAGLPLVFIIWGTFIFLGYKKYIYHWVLVIGAFVLAIFSYYSAYVFVPVFSVFLIFIYRKRIRFINGFLLLIILFGSSFIILFYFPGGQQRLKGISSFSDPDIFKAITLEGAREGTTGKIFHNRRLVYIERFLDGYFAPFRFDFLFLKTDTVRRMIVPGPGFGLLYWWDFPFLLLGLYGLLRNKTYGWQLPLLWLIIAPIGSAPTLPQPASTRVVLMVPALYMITAVGLRDFLKARSKFFILLVTLLFTVNTFLFIHQYFIHFPIEKSKDWFYSFKPLFQFLNQKEHSTKNVFFVFRPPDFLDQVYIFTLFYNHIDPSIYQQNGGTRLGMFGTSGEFSIGRYYFIPANCTDCDRLLPKNPRDLVITTHLMQKPPYTIIKSLNGEDTIYIYEIGDISIDSVLKITRQ